MSTHRISVQPKFVYGLRSDIKGNIHFLDNQDVIYPVAGVIAIHDFKTQKQTFLRLGNIIIDEYSFTTNCIIVFTL